MSARAPPARFPRFFPRFSPASRVLTRLNMYTLETVDLLACDFSRAAAAVSELRSAWEALSSPNDVKEEFSLSIKCVACGECEHVCACVVWRRGGWGMLYVTRYTLHVTRHTSHVARHTCIRDIVQAAATLSAGMHFKPPTPNPQPPTPNPQPPTPFTSIRHPNRRRRRRSGARHEEGKRICC